MQISTKTEKALFIFLAIVLLTGCSTNEKPAIKPVAGGSDILGHTFPEKSRIPEAVSRLADDYVASVNEDMTTQEREHVREEFLNGFFSGFTSPGAIRTGGTEAGRRGFTAGQEYYRANPAKIKETMEGFGYVPTEAEGKWTVFFEHSRLVPATLPEQKWWLSYFGEVQTNLPEGEPISGISVRITGYLSPKGHFGHLNSYDHEFFATKIMQIK